MHISKSKVKFRPDCSLILHYVDIILYYTMHICSVSTATFLCVTQGWGGGIGYLYTLNLYLYLQSSPGTFCWKAIKLRIWPLTFIQYQSQECVDLYIHSPHTPSECGGQAQFEFYLNQVLDLMCNNLSIPRLPGVFHKKYELKLDYRFRKCSVKRDTWHKYT